ncbi:MAG: sugar ABC transporter ATP-binding protein [Christensenella sp.]|uniref:sugar ABC transporter ATP-binding protein n=1 Tax=Christensenella sp. TaxID=1935934 RepID=UPI002B20398A|nr:sugar ABC transporter ATP-binding protein [Christensenella sp.]MEA5004243.1 sugar ABC transporter ATP-binding protein [Christensenella sp.]
MAEATNPIISAKNIVKSFSGVVVLKDVDFNIYPGEVHALIGENGAGKSTLMKIISGVHAPTSGELSIEGQPVVFKTPHDARAAGVALIHQEPLTFQDLNVTENIYLGHTRGESKLTINWKEKYKEAAELLTSLEVNMGPKDPVRGMTIADQQMIEITSALSQNAKVIIMDEPTAALSHGEVKTLFQIVQKLKQQGKGIVFIGHRLEEIMEISDRITVLRDGELVGECFKKDVDQDKLVQMMVGRTFKELIVKEQAEIGEVLLEAEHLTYPGKYQDVSINVRRGEIVGMAGLVGAGRSEVASAIFGTDPAIAGTIKINGEQVVIKSAIDSMKKGIAMISEDRAQTGLILPFSIKQNMTFAILKEISKGLFINTKEENKLVSEYSDYLRVKMRDADQPVSELSGGNQQKVVIAKWLLTEPDILILDEPTRGIDVGAKAEVYKLISELAKQGKAILMISSELQEILQLSDRVYVMCEGHVTAEMNKDEIDSAKIMMAASTRKDTRKEASQ